MRNPVVQPRVCPVEGGTPSQSATEMVDMASRRVADLRVQLATIRTLRCRVHKRCFAALAVIVQPIESRFGSTLRRASKLWELLAAHSR